MKSKPETKCERVPREFCRKEACDPQEGKDECYFRNQVVSESTTADHADSMSFSC